MKNPKMLFKSPGPHNWEGISHDWMVCDLVDIEKHLADGWHATIFEAQAAKPAEKIEAEPAKPVEAAPPNIVTREEMEAQASSLGIKVDGRWSDKRLSDEIAKAGQ